MLFWLRAISFCCCFFFALSFSLPRSLSPLLGLNLSEQAWVQMIFMAVVIRFAALCYQFIFFSFHLMVTLTALNWSFKSTTINNSVSFHTVHGQRRRWRRPPQSHKNCVPTFTHHHVCAPPHKHRNGILLIIWIEMYKGANNKTFLIAMCSECSS